MKNPQMNRMIIHIGLHKTGTTFLQRQYFPNFKNVNYCNGHIPLHDFGYEQKHDTFLVSNEALSGRPWNDKWKKGLKNDFQWMNSFKTAVNNLKLIFPEAHVVIVFRKHGDLLVSLYKQYIQEGGVLSFEDFYREEGVITEGDLVFVERLKFLRDNFKKVDVLSFEEFKKQGVNYYNRYFSSIECEVGDVKEMKRLNSSISGQKVEILRKVNAYYPRTPEKIKNILALSRFTPRRIFQEKLTFWNSQDPAELTEVKRRINEKFEADWQEVEKYTWK